MNKCKLCGKEMTTVDKNDETFGDLDCGGDCRECIRKIELDMDAELYEEEDME